MVSRLNMSPGCNPSLPAGIDLPNTSEILPLGLECLLVPKAEWENSDFIHCTGKEIAVWIPDTASTDIDVKGQMYRGLPNRPFSLRIHHQYRYARIRFVATHPT